MRISSWFVVPLLFMVLSAPLQAQPNAGNREREDEFGTAKPAIGEALPDLTVYNPDGTEFKTSDLKGHYTVLTFGCLTCPVFLWNVASMEAVHRDYALKGVKFYFVYKSLAHPELSGDYVQPFILEERLGQVRQAQKQLGASIPWIIDAIDNRMKHAMGDRPNSQFVIDPKGVIVRKRWWSHPAEVRKDLEQLVGPVERITKEEDVRLKIEVPLKSAAARGVVTRLKRPEMMAGIVTQPKLEPNGPPFFAKLRAEANPALFLDGAGKLYLGFHLDPFPHAHWNNLTKPLSFKLEVPEGVKLDRLSDEAPKVDAATDADPREFLLNVEAWPSDQPIRLIVTYSACVGEEACHAVRQEYTLYRDRDRDAGGARGEGAGYWNERFVRQMLNTGDKDGDGKLSRSEVRGLVLPHFDKLDVNNDGGLDHDELSVVTDWLNHHHQSSPTVPVTKRNAKSN